MGEVNLFTNQQVIIVDKLKQFNYNESTKSRDGDLKPIPIAELTVKNPEGTTCVVPFSFIRGVQLVEQSFKQRVANAAILYAEAYQDVFLNFEYLVCSDGFSEQDYYIIAAHAENYRHLIGVNTNISAEEFFNKCLSKTLSEADFSFVRRGHSESEIKGSVRRKILALPEFLSMFDKPLVAQEQFVKNRVCCSFATTDKSVTVGFQSSGKSRPKTLLRGNELDPGKVSPVELILRKRSGNQFFDEIIYGDKGNIVKYYGKIESLLAEELRPEMSKELVSV